MRQILSYPSNQSWISVGTVIFRDPGIAGDHWSMDQWDRVWAIASSREDLIDEMAKIMVEWRSRGNWGISYDIIWNPPALIFAEDAGDMIAEINTVIMRLETGRDG